MKKSKNKLIQEERIKSYFISATKSILKGEGLKSISVRNIAKEAGYSYATLYNYFKDANELVFECVKEFNIEIENAVNDETKNKRSGVSKIKAISNAYVKYFIQYPGIFELFFIEKATDLGYNNPAIKLVYSLLDSLCEEEWEYCIRKKVFTASEVSIKKELLKNCLVGTLLFYLNRYSPNDYVKFTELIDKQMNVILK